MLGHLPPLAKSDKYEFLGSKLQELVRKTAKFAELRAGEARTDDGAEADVPTASSSQRVPSASATPPTSRQKKKQRSPVYVVACPFTEDFDADCYQHSDSSAIGAFAEEEEVVCEEESEGDCFITGVVCNCGHCQACKAQPLEVSATKKDVAPFDDSSEEARNAPTENPKRGGQRIYAERDLKNLTQTKKRKLQAQSSQKLPSDAFAELPPESRFKATRRVLTDRRRLIAKTTAEDAPAFSAATSAAEPAATVNDAAVAEPGESASALVDVDSEPAPIKELASRGKPPPPGPPDFDGDESNALHAPFKMETRRPKLGRPGEAYLLHSPETGKKY